MPVPGLSWARAACLPACLRQVIDTDTYEVVCVSPRNHFLFTPMLPRWGGDAWLLWRVCLCVCGGIFFYLFFLFFLLWW